MTTIKIAGQEYPLALTLGAMEQLDEMCGGIENAAKVFDGKKMGQIVKTLVKMPGILIRGGCDYMAAEGQDAPKAPNENAIKAGLLPRDIPTAKTALFQAMADSMGRTVDVEPDQKNGGATQDT